MGKVKDFFWDEINAGPEPYDASQDPWFPDDLGEDPFDDEDGQFEDGERF